MTTPLRVLVVDDDPLARLTAEHALTSAGHEVHTAENGNEALTQVAQFPPDIILLDAVMPGMDGAAFLRSYDALPGPAARVILVSGYLHAPAEAIGVDAVLPKPYHVQDLLDQVQRCAAPTS